MHSLSQSRWTFRRIRDNLVELSQGLVINTIFLFIAMALAGDLFVLELNLLLLSQFLAANYLTDVVLELLFKSLFITLLISRWWRLILIGLWVLACRLSRIVL